MPTSSFLGNRCRAGQQVLAAYDARATEALDRIEVPVLGDDVHSVRGGDGSGVDSGQHTGVRLASLVADRSVGQAVLTGRAVQAPVSTLNTDAIATRIRGIASTVR